MSAIDAPVKPVVEFIDYDHEVGFGRLTINGRLYTMCRLKDGPRVVGLRLAYYDDKKEQLVLHDIDFAAEGGWTCDCGDATHRPGRLGGCKHIVAVRQVAGEMKCEKAEGRP